VNEIAFVFEAFEKRLQYFLNIFIKLQLDFGPGAVLQQ
jgi:hypothetical protein